MMQATSTHGRIGSSKAITPNKYFRTQFKKDGQRSAERGTAGQPRGGENATG